jgi:hypothetical protein
MPRGIETKILHCRLLPSIHAAFAARAAAEGKTISVWLAIVAEDSLPPDATEARTAANGANPAQTNATPEPPPRPLAAAIAAAIDAEIHHEQHRILGAAGRTALAELLDTPDLSSVTDLRTARAAGIDVWIAAGCGPGLAVRLFPDDPAGTARRAKQAQNQVQMAQRRAAAPPATQVASRYGIVGRGSAVLDRIMRERFPDMTVDDAVKLGADAWLDAGVTEAIGRALFNEDVAIEAKRRADARGNARRRGVIERDSDAIRLR